MPNIMHPNLFHSRLFCTSLHLMVEIRFCNRKQPFIWLDVIEHFDILLHFFAEKRGHFYGTVAFRCFRACNNITPFGTVVRLADRDRLLLEIKISSSKSQQLTGTDTAPVKHFKSIKGTWLIHHGF